MEIRKTYLTPIKIEAVCKCGGTYHYEKKFGMHDEFDPKGIFHKCNKCGDEVFLENRFPRIEYEEEGNGWMRK